MFSPINKQVTSKFQSAHKQQICPQKSTNTKVSRTIPQVPVEATRLHSLRRGSKVKNGVKNVVKTEVKSAVAPRVVVASQVFEKKPPAGNQTQSQTQQIPGVPPRTQPTTTRIIAFGKSLSYPDIVPNFRRRNPISGGNDFKVTKSAYKPTMSTIFSYDLSPLERHDYGGLCQKNPLNPMKLVPQKEVQLLQSGQRSTYLEERSKLSPETKYNYPEATSMRYGWFHHLGDPFQKRVPRRE